MLERSQKTATEFSDAFSKNLGLVLAERRCVGGWDLSDVDR
jgi:hypothetical protein